MHVSFSRIRLVRLCAALLVMIGPAGGFVAAQGTPFKVEPGALPNSLVVSDTNGGAASQIGLGIDSPQADLHIVGSTSASIRLEDSVTTFQVWDIFASQSGFDINDITGGLNVLCLDPISGDVGLGDTTPDADFDIERGATFSNINAGATTFTTSSSRELKENIRPCEAAGLLAKLAAVPVCTFDWKPDCFGGEAEDRTDNLGLIAEEFHTILSRGSDTEINGQDVQMVLWMAVQELHARGQTQQETITQLQAQNVELVARLEALERQLATGPPAGESGPNVTP